MKSSRIVRLAMFTMAVFGGVKMASADPVYSFTTINVPGATATYAFGINASGQIVGCFTDTSGKEHGFLDTAGSLTIIDVPRATNTQVYGINDGGQIVGAFLNASGFSQGFLDTSGSFTIIDVPGAGYSGTGASGINDRGQIVGTFQDASGFFQGFLDTAGSFTTIDVPGAMNPSASGINDSGQIVGYYPPMYVHGFLDTGGNFTTIDIPGATGTSAQGINDSGEIVGVFYEPGEISGYLATPVATPEPASLITLATCLVTLSGRAWHRKRALPQIAPQRDLEHCGGLLLLLPRRVEAALAKHHRPHCSDAPLALIAHERHVEDGVGAWAWFW